MNITNPTSFGSPALVYSTANSSGSGGALRADDTLAVFSTTVPTNISTSTVSASTGDNAFTSREDHVHGSTAVIAAASAAEVLAATSNTVWVSPGRAQANPGVAKGWCHGAADGTLDSTELNVTGITRNSAGNYTISWLIDFSSTSYVGLASVDGDDVAGFDWTTYAVGSLRMTTYVDGSAADRKFWVVAFGIQV